MRLTFAGTPEFAVPSLRALIDSEHELVAVLCQPDRPAGRGRKLRACAVKQLAVEHRLTVWQPRTLKSGEAHDRLRALAPDLIVVAAFGLIFPQSVLDIPRLGCINVHASLLPRWRGAAPIARAIEAGDAQTGVCLMHMEAGLDTGPVYACRSTPIDPGDTAGTLHDRLAAAGGELLGQQLPLLLGGELQARSQDSSQATYASKLSKTEAVIDWADQAVRIERRIRAFNPWPMACTWLGDMRLRIHQAQLAPGGDAAPGTVQAVGEHGIVVACGERSALCLERVQRDGGKPLAVADFLHGHDIRPGQRLGAAPR